jgi:hypothetical protein
MLLVARFITDITKKKIFGVLLLVVWSRGNW